jgi:hypothetical protein
MTVAKRVESMKNTSALAAIEAAAKAKDTTRSKKNEAAKVKSMTRPKPREAKQPKRRDQRKQKHKIKGDGDEGPAVPLAVFTIPMFCATHDLSESFYFKLKSRGLGPREMRVGTGKKGRVLISLEAAADWRRARENAQSEMI